MLLNNDNTRLTPAGDLEIDVKAVHRVSLYFKPWDQALEVYVNDIDGEVNVFRIDPGIPILSQACNCAAGSDLNVFVDRIPQQIRRVAARFVFNQTLVLQWAARYQAANDLISSNPILLWLLVGASQTRYWQEAYIKKILSLRQDAIIGELIGTASKPAVKILRKINLKEGSQREYGLIMWGLKQNRVLDAVRHLKIIPVQILAMLFHVPELISGKAARMIESSLPEQIGVLDAMAEATRIQRVQEDTINLGRTLGFAMPQQIVADCSSVRQLDRLHEKWTGHLNDVSFTAIDNCFFPEPPLAGTNSIIPITNTLGLLQEGREMHHCVGGYSGSVLNSECFIYKVLKPQRATLAVRIRGKSLAVDDLRTFKNGRPSEQCRKIVEQWLHPERDLEKCLPQSFDRMGVR